MTPEIYLDANATCPVLPAAIDAALDALGPRFGNPSSSHAAGLRAKAILDEARACARRVIGAGDGRLMFTSGATEGIQTAVLSVLWSVRERQLAGQPCGRLLVYGATEHKAVPESLAHWNRLLGTNLELAVLPVDGEGRHRLDVLRELAPDAAMVCTMAANNETGTVSDLEGIARVLGETGSGAYWMVDCVQALGKLPLALASTRIDYAPFSGHKLCAPKGIGMLYVRAGAPFTPLVAGGGQEAGQRSGTENMAGIAAFGAVLKALEQGQVFRGHDALVESRDRVVQALREAFPGIVFNSPLEHALPTTINFSVPGLSSRDVLDVFDAAAIRVSAGSACSASKAQPSYVLQAMGLPLWRAASAVRLSFGPQADEAFIDAACERIRRCSQALRADPLVLAPSAHHGLLQVNAEGCAGWLVFDADEKSCVAIDIPAPMAARIASLAKARRYTVRAILGDAACSSALCSALAELGVPFHAGWPAATAEVALAGGLRAPAIRIGAQWLANADGGYLLGAVHGETLPRVEYAFIGASQAACECACADTILCRNADDDALGWSAIGAEAAFDEHEMHLAPAALEDFLQAHPDAVLVDVREASEHAAGPVTLHGRVAQSVPLSRMAEHAASWLREGDTPRVFLCRSGNRSAKAARQLRRFGFAQAWHVAGGVALAV
ncbi:hypothetical protein GCM10027321_36830 [Massilia terrae]|uniref:cysteine desulfurase n=1 Tax=Massilia terrae TaxID=1811224 RepID=A0ABT2CY27_9BURK|nr:aminotransferase class V-fold PLP-dependent enzyme [Massilia terrae]MCS0658759.1 aminotransferase class V-fold PLP-dependent enzyme [Massilia terrae]